MNDPLNKMRDGYRKFSEKYAKGENSVMESLSSKGQNPEIMIISCCDSRVDPALILQCDPGELFIVRNVANIVPPYEKDEKHHGTSAALEFGICFLKIRHLILLGHSQCGGIQARLNKSMEKNDFITSWTSLIDSAAHQDIDECAKHSLHQSRNNCLAFPWIKEKLETNQLSLHVWFFDIKSGQILAWDERENKYNPFG